jgi:hypothetical protein
MPPHGLEQETKGRSGRMRMNTGYGGHHLRTITLEAAALLD